VTVAAGHPVRAAKGKVRARGVNDILERQDVISHRATEALRKKHSEEGKIFVLR
jgi:hypothetical protein